MAISKPDPYLVVNGVQFPCPDEGMSIIETTSVDGGRNMNNAVVGQVVGRNQWKLDGLQWSHLDADTWKTMKQALAPFYVPVSFTDDYGTRHTLYMYPGDRTSQPMRLTDIFITKFSTCKFNLIDCGWDE